VHVEVRGGRVWGACLLVSLVSWCWHPWAMRDRPTCSFVHHCDIIFW
jgi:hypothetical protein